jgi:hypothetical protein
VMRCVEMLVGKILFLFFAFSLPYRFLSLIPFSPSFFLPLVLCQLSRRQERSDDAGCCRLENRASGQI